MFRFISLAVGFMALSLVFADPLDIDDIITDSVLKTNLGGGLGGIGGIGNQGLPVLDDLDDFNIIDPRYVVPYRVPVSLGGRRHVSSLPDLVNLVFGLGGHIVGRSGWIVHDAVRSLAEGVLTSRYKLTNYDDIGAPFGF